jgi:hypothetical protein
MLDHIFGRHGIGPELAKVQAMKVKLVEMYSALIREGSEDATPFAFVTDWVRGLDVISPPAPETRAAWRAMLRRHDAKRPFPPHMGRILPSNWAKRA